MFIESIKQSLNNNSELYKSNKLSPLSHYDDNIGFSIKILEEPLLSSFNKLNNIELDQICFGYFKNKKPIILSIDNNGIAYIPNFGYIMCNEYNQKGIFDYKKKIVTLNSGENLNIKIIPLKFILRKKIELFYFDIEPIKQRLKDLSLNVFFFQCTNENLTDINKYLGNLKFINHDIYNIILNYCKSIYFFKSNEIHSFTEITLNGIIFLNSKLLKTEIDFIEQLVHEVAHTILNISTIDKNNWFIVDELVPNYFSTFKNKKRGLIYCLHACFVSHMLLVLFDSYIKKNKNNEMYYQCVGRLVYYLKLQENGLKNIDFADIFNFKGIELLGEMKELLTRYNKKYRIIISKYKIATQEQEFNFNLFKIENNLA